MESIDDAGVIRPLQEAAEYERLQLFRRRGLYNLAVGGFGVAFPLLFELSPPFMGTPFGYWFFLAVFVLLAGTAMLLTHRVRRKPEWVPVFPQRVTWSRLDARQMGRLGIAFILVVVASRIDETGMTPTGQRIIATAALIALTVSVWWNTRFFDRTIATATLLAAPGALLLLLGIVPLSKSIFLGLLLLACPLVLIGAFRSVAPLRWLR